ncbi:MAG: amidohydrolase family protein [Chloroflexota bacterium]
MARQGFKVMDSDLHLMEPEDLWERRLEEPYKSQAPEFLGAFNQPLAAEDTSNGGNADAIYGMKLQDLLIPAAATVPAAVRERQDLIRRSRARTPHYQRARASGFDAASTLAAMDIEGIDVAVMYGTRGRQILMHDDIEPAYAAALARAYNDWAAAYCQASPRRLKFAAQIAMHDIGRAVSETRRAATELGAAAVIGTPNPVNGQHLHDDAVEPLWDELESLNIPIGFHPTGQSSLRDDVGTRFVGHANFQPIAHAARGPLELMLALASMTSGGVLERHPRLRAGFLEGTAGWLWWWLWRLDDHWEKFGAAAGTPLSMLPSDYFKRQCLVALDVDEEPAVHVIHQLGAEYFVVSTDYPHEDSAFPEAMEQFFALDLTDEARRKILWDNCARFYNLEALA